MAHGRDGERRPWWRRLLKTIGIVVGVIVAAAVALVAVLTITEYHPDQVEPAVRVASGEAGEGAGGSDGGAQPIVSIDAAKPGETLSVAIWNIGYGALGDNADFLLDGGAHMITSSNERVARNMDEIVGKLEALEPDIAIVQEVDRDSDRSAHIDEAAAVAGAFPDAEAFYATNYRTLFVPIGLPPYGKIESGLLTLSSFTVTEAERDALPDSYSWPMSTVQLKRCQLVTRIPVEGTSRELVIVNEHLDAYADKEHHARQIESIFRLLNEEAAKGNYVIAGGDWNGTFSNVDSSAYPLLDSSVWQPAFIDAAALGEGWQFIQDNSVPTCRLLDHPLVDASGKPTGGPVQYYLIDGFIVSGNVEVRSVETQDLGFEASDHNPVLMKVVLR